MIGSYPVIGIKCHNPNIQGFVLNDLKKFGVDTISPRLYNKRFCKDLVGLVVQQNNCDLIKIRNR